MGKELFEKLELFLFDMDGLLFDTETIYVEEGKRLAKEMGRILTDELVEKTTGITNDKAQKIYEKEFGEDFPFKEYFEKIKDIIKEKASRGEVPLMEGAIEFLEFLKENNKKMVLATSSDLKMTTALIGSKNLEKYFSHYVTSEDVVHGKPDPEVFLIGAAKENIMPKNTAVFEDSFNGIRAAYAAKMYPIMVPDKLQPTEEIKKMCFKEFKSLLDVLNYFKNGIEK